MHRHAIGTFAETGMTAASPPWREKDCAMIPYDIDPSLHGSEPEPQLLDDGFSPRPSHESAPVEPDPLAPSPDCLPGKSAF